MATVSVLAVGDTFTAAVENDIANQLNQMHAYMVLTNPNVSSTGAGTATWLTIGNITVPAWATKARVCLVATGIAPSANPTSAEIAVKIGSSTGATKRWTGSNSPTRESFPHVDLLTSVPTGSQSVTIQATSVAGTFLAPSTVCSIDLNIDWLA